MAKTSVMIRLDDAELAALDAVATEMERTRASVVMVALKRFLGDVSRETPKAIPPLRGGEITTRGVDQSLPPKAEPKPPDYKEAKAAVATPRRYLADPSTCKHRLRQLAPGSLCPACGAQR